MEAEVLGDIFHMAFGGSAKLRRDEVVIMCILERRLRAKGACDFMVKRNIGTFVHVDYATWCREMDGRILPAIEKNPHCPWRICGWPRGANAGFVEAKPRLEPACIYTTQDLLRAADTFEFTIGLIVPDECHTRQAMRNFHRKVDCSLFQTCFVHGWEDMHVRCTRMKSGNIPFELYKGSVAIVNCLPVFHNWWSYSELQEEKILSDILKTIFESMCYDFLAPTGNAYPRQYRVSRAQLLRVQSYENFPIALYS